MRRFVAIGVAVARLISPAAAAAEGRTPTVIDLGAPTPNGFSVALSISDSRIIAGRSDLDAVYWRGTALHTVTPPPPAGGGQEAIDVNLLGQLAGDITFFVPTLSFLPFWTPIPGGPAELLPTTGFKDGRASGINVWGLVAGTSQIETQDPNTIAQRAVVWFEGRIHDLGTLGGPGAIADTSGIVNDFGVVVGASEIETTVIPGLGQYRFHATMWTGVTTGHPVARDLGVLAKQPEHQFSLAKAINDIGQVVGWALTDIPDPCFGGSQQWGFEFERGEMHGLPPLDGDCDAEASRVNLRGQVVGVSYGLTADGSFTERAVIWKNGKAVDLTALLPPDSGWQLLDANGINDFGDIVGFGINPDGIGRAFLLRR